MKQFYCDRCGATIGSVPSIQRIGVVEGEHITQISIAYIALMNMNMNPGPGMLCNQCIKALLKRSQEFEENPDIKVVRNIMPPPPTEAKLYTALDLLQAEKEGARNFMDWLEQQYAQSRSVWQKYRLKKRRHELHRLWDLWKRESGAY